METPLSKPTEEPPPLEIDPESPWADHAEEQAASAVHYSDLSNTTGLAFREAQQEAMEAYLRMEEPELDPEPTVPPDPEPPHSGT